MTSDEAKEEKEVLARFMSYRMLPWRHLQIEAALHYRYNTL
jgi:hypothetical protein